MSLVNDGPTANTGAVSFEVEAAEQFAGGGPVGGRRIGGEEFDEQHGDFDGPVRAMIAAGDAGRPTLGVALGAGTQISGAQLVETAGAEVQLGGDLLRGELAGAGQGQEVTDQGRGNTVSELMSELTFFIAPR